MKIQDKALIGGLIYKTVIDVMVLAGLLMADSNELYVFLIFNFFIEIIIDMVVILRIYNFNKMECE